MSPSWTTNDRLRSLLMSAMTFGNFRSPSGPYGMSPMSANVNRPFPLALARGAIGDCERSVAVSAVQAKAVMTMWRADFIHPPTAPGNAGGCQVEDIQRM